MPGKDLIVNIYNNLGWPIAVAAVVLPGCAPTATTSAHQDAANQAVAAKATLATPTPHKLAAAAPTSSPVLDLPPQKPQLILHLPVHKPIVALTFDACQTRKPARYDSKIIQILRQTKTPATLMLGGRWMETHPAVTQGLASNPLFELGNHSYLHPHMTKISLAQMRAELQKTQDIMFRLTGRKARLFRPPYGEYDAKLVKVAGDLGLKTLMWDVETGDPDPHESAKSIIHTVTHQARPGSIVIMHVNGRGWHSAEALPTIIRTLRQQGFTFATVSQALQSGAQG